MVHGFALDQRMWRYQIEEFSKSFLVVSVDVPGCGKSPAMKNPALADLAVEIFEAVRPLMDGQPAVYMGLSMGGYIGWEMLSRFPTAFRAAVMCDTRAAADLPTTAEGRRQMAKKVLEDGVESVLAPMIPRLLCDETLAEQPETVELMQAMMFASTPQSIHDHQLAMSQRTDFTSSLSNFTLPMLLICGTDDILTPPKEMKRLSDGLPCSSYVEIEKAGHMAPLEQPARVNEHIAQFLHTLS
jgi:3-oxoadipate enol-lactonase